MTYESVGQGTHKAGARRIVVTVMTAENTKKTEGIMQFLLTIIL